ncbi:uncharacterized protein LOC143509839 isoform X3 [Brachyhypopomus gauderio]|uniref:uncharacterized protein LOC143509839 isoform X3 n=1 Tax=Brachyhypopomus gauderio TaxID=698409 RepID=UPI0040422D04
MFEFQRNEPIRRGTKRARARIVLTLEANRARVHMNRSLAHLFKRARARLTDPGTVGALTLAKRTVLRQATVPGPGSQSLVDLNSTYTLDYLPPHITIKDTIPAEVVEDRKPDFRRRLSCFTDVAGHRRWGRNTWQDVNETQARPHGAAETLHTPLDRGCT